MESLMERDPYDDMGPESTREFVDLGPVEVAPDYRLEISVPLTPEQLDALADLVQEQGKTHGEVIRELLDEALAARRAR